MGICSLAQLYSLLEMLPCLLLYTAAAAVAAVVVTMVSDQVALLFDVDLDIDTAVADVGRIAAEMVDSAAVDSAVVDSVGYLYRGIVVDMALEVLEVDRSNHSQRLGPMLHNFDRTAFVVAAFVVAGWN
mmetsp:Transcript_3968/g.6874  ORF Transcript_3968/g.6874 Transcript_3968/m.6874 type:complete len:129 (-) Transcript_3968:828-1214(-)